MRHLKIEDLIVLDESGCHLNMTSTHARAIGGKRIKMPVAFRKGPKISVIGAISASSVEAVMYGEWNTDGEIFTAFIEKFLVPQLSSGKILIMDNIKFHSTAKAVKAIEATGATILFLPPYSPEFSPIENMWSKLKQILKTAEPRTWGKFQSAIKKAFLEITESDLIGWFQHCHFLNFANEWIKPYQHFLLYRFLLG